MLPTFKGVRAGVPGGTNISEKDVLRKPDPYLQEPMFIPSKRTYEKNEEGPAK